MDSLGNYRLGRFRLFLMPPSWRPTLGTRVIAYTTIAMYLWILLPFIIGGRASRLLQLCFLFVLLNIIASSLLLLRAACTDPGIVLRSRSPPADAERFRLKNGRYPRSKPATVNGVNTHAWFCGTCLKWIPPRGFHCKTCDVCVQHFDHHCEFTGSCIGKRNYGLFLGAAFTASLAGLLSTVCIVLFVVELASKSSEQKSVLLKLTEGLSSKATLKLVVLAFLMVLGLVFFFSFAGLLLLHLQLLKENITHHEMVRSGPLRG
uniref:Palmitoyltransferase n=1 Tax=Rhodosorus marinus TaxID=101924 RepID=A0A7S3A9H1_9RHOD|mmetsp:Transcript_6513/g.27715  ORF Transcript_6513/g.27715 Transcript_6513/m.27715 type:complete len:262 (+) Transcript_6513:3109-3894(+)